MKTEWDYTELAEAYLKRPDYAEDAIDTMLQTAGVKNGAPVCDVGAGVAHLTLMLAGKGYRVTAVEPNDNMRKFGQERTRSFDNVQWFEGTGEKTEQADHAFDLVTFGSSFNVTDRPKALMETKRILKPRGWFACMWNHRDLEDPIQDAIEKTIQSVVSEYTYGTRREDQTEVIDASGLFGSVKRIEGAVQHVQSIADCVEAWRSHATLSRQAGDRFAEVVRRIEELLKGMNTTEIQIPYTTRIWMAQLKE